MGKNVFIRRSKKIVRFHANRENIRKKLKAGKDLENKEILEIYKSTVYKYRNILLPNSTANFHNY